MGSSYDYIKRLDFAFTNNDSIEITKALLTFVTGYIASVIIELIAILKYIVRNVFDSSIAELVKLFKDNYDFNPNNKQQNNKLQNNKRNNFKFRKEKQ